jgi:hypothetical protein
LFPEKEYTTRIVGSTAKAADPRINRETDEAKSMALKATALRA